MEDLCRFTVLLSQTHTHMHISSGPLVWPVNLNGNYAGLEYFMRQIVFYFRLFCKSLQYKWSSCCSLQLIFAGPEEPNYLVLAPQNEG